MFGKKKEDIHTAELIVVLGLLKLKLSIANSLIKKYENEIVSLEAKITILEAAITMQQSTINTLRNGTRCWN